MFDEIDQKLIQIIQTDIPLTLDPYGDIAREIGCSKTEVIQRLQSYSQSGRLKRISAVLHHRDAGYKYNGMLACIIPEDKIEAAGSALAAITQVSHCYERKTDSEWPYNLYGMVHGHTHEEVEQVVSNFVSKMQIQHYQILYSIEELKKASMIFFNPL
jgi:DNA-binding Lrp family transcriptional regulator